MAQVQASSAVAASNPAKRVKLTGRAFYESIGSPKMIVAPMVDRSEFAWRLLTRSYLDESERKQILAYSPMYHARLFQEQAKYRDAHFQPTKESLISKMKSQGAPFLDGHPEVDRPLFVQFCANRPEEFLEAAQYVAPYCDAVDLNLGCPQGIAKSGHYGAFLQEDWDTIYNLIRKLRDELDVPVTAKFRIQETKERTLEYAKMILDAGASIITVHGRQRHQKGHHTGLADWSVIRYLRDHLPPDTVLLANGNILNRDDLQPCLDATGADGVMSAEGNLSDPTIFARVPAAGEEGREYWRDQKNPKIGGYRIDGVFRRYLDIIYRYVLEREPPRRPPLYLPGERDAGGVNSQARASLQSAGEAMPDSGVDAVTKTEQAAGVKRANEDTQVNCEDEQQAMQKLSKKHRKKHAISRDMAAVNNPNLKSIQGHLFQLLRPLLSNHTHIRDALARSRAGDIGAFENVLSMVEEAVRQGLDEEYARSLETADGADKDAEPQDNANEECVGQLPADKSSAAARERCNRPFWVCQPHVRPLPEEALKIGSIQLSKKEKKELAEKAKLGQQPSAEPMKVQSKSQAAATGELLVGNQILSDGEKVEHAVHELPHKEALACG